MVGLTGGQVSTARRRGCGVVALLAAAACTPDWVAHRTSTFDRAVVEASPKQRASLDDPPPAGGTLTIDAAVRDVLARNPDLAAMRSGIRAMIAMARERSAPPEPMLEIGIDPLTLHTGLGQMIAYRQPLGWSSALAARANAALHEGEAMDQDLEAMRRMLGALAGEAVAEHAASRAMEHLLVRHHDLMDLMARAARARISAGRGEIRDPIRAEAEKAKADRDRVEARRMAAAAWVRLQTLAHRRPDAPEPVCDPDTVLGADPGPLPAFDRLLGEAETDRPDIKAADARVAARQAEVDEAEVMRRPMMSVGITLNTMQEDPMMWPSLTFSIELPAARDRRQAMVDGAALRLEEARDRATGVRGRVSGEVGERRADLIAVQEALTIVDKKLLPAAQKSLELAIEGYRRIGPMAGLMGLDPVVLAAEVVLDARMSRVDLLRRRLIATLMLNVALGRVPGLPQEPASP